MEEPWEPNVEAKEPGEGAPDNLNHLEKKKTKESLKCQLTDAEISELGKQAARAGAAIRQILEVLAGLQEETPVPEEEELWDTSEFDKLVEAKFSTIKEAEEYKKRYHLLQTFLDLTAAGQKRKMTVPQLKVIAAARFESFWEAFEIYVAQRTTPARQEPPKKTKSQTQEPKTETETPAESPKETERFEVKGPPGQQENQSAGEQTGAEPTVTPESDPNLRFLTRRDSA
jgi:hypothetical protein